MVKPPYLLLVLFSLAVLDTSMHPACAQTDSSAHHNSFATDSTQQAQARQRSMWLDSLNLGELPVRHSGFWLTYGMGGLGTTQVGGFGSLIMLTLQNGYSFFTARYAAADDPYSTGTLRDYGLQTDLDFLLAECGSPVRLASHT